MNTKPKTPEQVAFETAQERLTSKIFHQAWEDISNLDKQAWRDIAQAVLAAQWRSVDNPPVDQEQLVICGGGKYTQVVRFCLRTSDTTHWAEITQLPEPPVDPYAELKAAYAAGKVIQWCDYGHWKDLSLGTDDPLLWFHPAKDYRIKPWELSRHIPGFRPLEDSEEWHRNDFTEDMLPDGYRPLLDGERVMHQDQLQDVTNQKLWTAQIINDEKGLHYQKWMMDRHFRTTRPLPPTKVEQEIAEFETWWNDPTENADSQKELCFKAWKAARRATKNT